ncbi:response regulator [Pedobacter changchengzhani]|uniref:histidine kinase n=1 Tax=Pedobacter changchengzhani TaxID=2529274 RepID=A0A4R5MPZ7_9SPHI|nr:two-component regulator propeller domain-containing protein [Pedobacter changchengzhani]TDG37269.1 response regulator [Pedobacter changchengzhani]
MMKKLALIFLLSVLSTPQIIAQKIFFRNYTSTDGLCANTIWDIEQDDQGFMWFGTKYGLNRFDGHEFKSYQFNKKNKNSLGNNFIHKIFKYDAKTFWIGTEAGIYIFDLPTETFKLFEPIGKAFINDIYKDSKNNIWIATKSNGAYRYQIQKKHITNYIRTASGNGLSSNEISKIVEDNSGQIWVGTYGQGIDVLDPQHNRIKNFHTSSAVGSLSNNFILSILKDLDGNIWVGTMSGGLNCFYQETQQFKVYVKGGENDISDNIVRDIYQFEKGTIYFATEKGLNILNTQTGLFTNYQSRNDDLYSLSDDAVYTVFKDREGGFWIGTYFGGLNYYNSKFSNLEYYYSSGAANSLVGNAVSSFLKVGDHQILIGTEDAGLNSFNTKDKTFKRYPFAPNQQKLSYHNIHALFEDKQKNIWIGMYTGGLNILNPTTGNIKRYTSNPNNPLSLSDNSVYAINEDREGRIWVSTISGLNLYDAKADNFIRIKDKYLEKSCIYQVYQDKDGIIWIATYDNGLVRMDKAGRTTRFVMNSSSNSINSNKVISILDDGKGNLWLGTDGGGLSVFNIKTEKFTDYNEKYGIESNVIYGVVMENDQTFWLSTNKGIYELDLKAKSAKNIDRWDNSQSQQYNYKAFLKDSDGKIYFGGIKGFNAFMPVNIHHSIQNAPIVLTNFQIFNKDVVIGDKNSPLVQSINFTNKIILKPNQSVISFEYAQLSFIAPNKTQYAFKMEGFDKDWNKVGTQQKATYTNLPAGNYRFLVTDLNNTVNPYQNAYHIDIEILPPFYRTKIAYFLYAIVIILLAYLLSKYFLEKTRQQNEIKLERLKNINEKEFYKQKIEFFTVMAHEIRTPLSLIIAPLEKMLSKKQLDEENLSQLQTMEENSDRLLTLVNQLLDFRRIESDIYNIHVEKVELVSLITSIKDKFSAMTYQKGINFSVQCNEKVIYAMLDPEAINKIISNLLINASKFARKNVVISIGVKLAASINQKVISISVEDDGIGIPESQIESIFTKFFKVQTQDHYYSNLGGSGIGLALAKSLVEKHEGNLSVHSQQNVKTTFTLEIPFNEGEVINQQVNLPIGESEEGQQTVLVVEDDFALLKFISENYESAGYFVIKANNGLKALELLDKHQVDMVVSDVMMPVMDGIEMCKKIKNNIAYSHLPVILLTAKTDSDSVTEGLENGADAYISKPFKWKNLALITKNLMELRQNLKQRFSQSPFESFEILPAGTKDKDFMNKLIALIEDRIADPLLSVEELGRDIGLSRSSLYKKIKSMTGYVPNEFIRVIRLKNAARLLMTKEYNISEIGYMVGFSSHSYFSKCFHQQFKVTPSEFSDQSKTDLNT